MTTDPRVARTRKLVLDAATRILRERGPRGVTIEGVAAASGVAKTTIYRHWEDRTALLLDVFSQFQMSAPIPSPGPLAERLRPLLRSFVAMHARPEWQAILPTLVAAARQPSDLRAAMAGSTPPHDRPFSTVIADAVATGELAPDTDPAECLLQLLSPVIVCTLWTPHRLGDDFADRLVDLFVTSRVRSTGAGVKRPDRT